MSKKIIRHQDLDAYRKAVEAAMQIFELSKNFPKEETYSLTTSFLLPFYLSPFLPF